MTMIGIAISPVALSGVGDATPATPETIVSVVVGAQSGGDAPVEINVTGTGQIRIVLRKGGVDTADEWTRTVTGDPFTDSLPISGSYLGSDFTLYVENVGNTSNAESAQFTLDTTAAVLSSPTTANVTATTADLQVTSDTAGDTLYVVAYPTGASEPSAAQIIAGNDGDDAAATFAGNDTSLAAVNTIAASGLTAETEYQIRWVQRDAQGFDSIIEADSVTTTAAATFHPTDLFAASQTGALYIADPQYLFTDTGGTTQVSADGQAVAYWADASGNGHHRIQTDVGLRPTYRTNGSIHKVEWAGGTNQMNAAVTGSDAANFMRGAALVTSDANGCVFPYTGSAPFAGMMAAGNGTAPDSAAGPVTYRANGVDLPGATRATLATNWATGSIMAAIAEGIDTSGQTPQFGRYGSNTSESFAFSGDLYCEVLREQLSTQERSDLETWMQSLSTY